MDSTKKGLLSLIKSSITGEKTELPENFDWETAIKTAINHRVGVMLYYGIQNSGVKISPELLQKLEGYMLQMLQLDTVQQIEADKLFNALNNAQIDFMPLKGSILKGYYPQTHMRFMCDIDVLIKEEQYDKIVPVMESIGYEFKIESNHEYVWNKGKIHVELHKILIPSYNKDYYEYYEDGWKKAVNTTTTRYCMSDEDFFIYNFTHLAKHYRDSGIGIRLFTDIWVYKREKPGLNEEYIKAELKKLQLHEFYENCMRLIGVWFGNEKNDAVTDFMTDWIFDSGLYGTMEKQELSMALKKAKSYNNKKNAQLRFIWDKMFPSYDFMCNPYPTLRKIPVLLPFLWIIRLADKVLFKRKEVKMAGEKLKRQSLENITEYEDCLHEVGLDFNFKEA